MGNVMNKFLKHFLSFTLLLVVLSSNAHSEWDLSIERIIAPSNNPEIQYNPEPGVRDVPLLIKIMNWGYEPSPDFVINFEIINISDSTISFSGNKEISGFKKNEYKVIDVFRISEKLEPGLYSVSVSISFNDLPPDSEDGDLSDNVYPRENQDKHIFEVTDQEPKTGMETIIEIISPVSNIDNYFYEKGVTIPIEIIIHNISVDTIMNCNIECIIYDSDDRKVYHRGGELIPLPTYHAVIFRLPGLRAMDTGTYKVSILKCDSAIYPENDEPYTFEIRDTVVLGDFDILEVYSPKNIHDSTYTIYDQPQLKIKVHNISKDTVYQAQFRAKVRSQYNVPIYESFFIEKICLPDSTYIITFPDSVNLSFGYNKLKIIYMQTDKELTFNFLFPDEEYIINAEDITSVKENDYGAVIYPNPFRDRIIVNLDENLGEPISFSLYNSLGNKIFEANNVYSDSHIELKLPSELLNGIYTYRIISGNKIFTGKLLKIE
jgi:hypothetical protein